MKIAILGTGFIVQEGVLVALKDVPEIKIEAIFARPKSKDKADKLAADHSIAKVYTDYDKLLADTDIDFVYVGLTNSVHYEYTKKALNAGKNVIVEKPFASTANEVNELKNLALQKHLYVFEAVTLLHCPNYHAIKKILPQIGKICAVVANYSQYSSRYDKYLQGEVLPAFDPKLSGGALYDINIYNLNFIIDLFGAPNEVDYTANIGFNGIDTSGFVTLRYQDFFAVALGAKDSASPGFITIQGERGYIHVIGAPNELKAFDTCIDGKIERHELNQYEHRMVHEFKEFAQIYKTNDYGKMSASLETSLAVLQTAEKARKKAGIVFACDN